MRVTFHEELSSSRTSLQQRASSSCGRCRLRRARWSSRTLELADEVIAFDDEVDNAYFAIQEGIQSLLARQTPVASDLRLVLAMLHVNLHLERMADYCVTVAKLTKLAGAAPSATEDRRRAGGDGRRAPRR